MQYMPRPTPFFERELPKKNGVKAAVKVYDDRGNNVGFSVHLYLEGDGESQLPVVQTAEEAFSGLGRMAERQPAQPWRAELMELSNGFLRGQLP